MRLLQLARFNAEGKIELCNVDIDSEPYIAISHVWDVARWQRISSFPKQILVSDQKAAFLKSTFPGLVGDIPFWMDVICVDQTNQVDKKTIIQSFPAIYRQAVKTIAVRDGDGFHDCCRDAIGNFDSWEDEGLQRLIHHLQSESKHLQSDLQESYLARLWTLNEILLSNNLHFTTCRPRKGRKTEDWYSAFWTASRLREDLNTLGGSWLARGNESSPSYEDFVRAFLDCDKVSRGEGTRAFDCIEDFQFRALFRNSSRRASRPSDYVLAMFPQFSWYSVPANVKDMDFGRLFYDCYQQSREQGRGFSALLIGGMTTPVSVEGDEAWNAGLHVPEPTCLGDFLKLVGDPLGSANLLQGHFASSVIVSLPHHQLDFGSSVRLIKRNIVKFPLTWWEAHIGGELFEYGSWAEMAPDSLSLLESIQQQRSETELLDPETQRIESSFLEQTLQSYKRALLGRLEDDWILPQTRMILDSMCIAYSGKYVGQGLTGYKSDLRIRISWLLKDQPWGYKEALLLMAAMIGCRMPLSAYQWVRSRFYPVSIKFPRARVPVLGLLSHYHGRRLKARARFLYMEKALPDWPGLREYQTLCTRKDLLIVVERGYKDGGQTGRSLVLVDPFTKFPVGLLPDFTYMIEKDEVFVQHMWELYYSFEKVSENTIKVATFDIRDFSTDALGRILDLQHSRGPGENVF